MKVEFYGNVRQYHNIKEEIDTKLQEVILSGKYVMGPMLKQFEEEFAKYMGTKYAVGVGSGTDALWLTFMALGVGPGDEVITHPNTFFATVEAIWIAGATAVMVDCDCKTKNIEPGLIEAAITEKTKMIVPVHLYGHCANMKAIRAIADKYNLYVVEDNAQGIDGYGDGFRQGELSDAVCTSFVIQKNLGCFGDGGAALTNNEDIDSRIRIMRNHGSAKRSYHSPGFNSRLDDLQAGILSAKLKHITEWTEQRRKWASLYSEGLQGAKNIALPYEEKGYRHVYHLYVIETKDREKRNSLLKYLNGADIDAKCHYDIAIHQQEGYPWGKGSRIVGSSQNAEQNAATCLSLPMYPELTEEEVKYVISTTLEWDKANS